MKVAILFSGGKDSTLAALLAKKAGHELCCLVSVLSENKASYMFHTPSINCTEVQAEVMGLPIVLKKTRGEKEKELEDLREVILEAKEKFGIGGVVTGAVGSVYQESRIGKICCELGLECINPLWGMKQMEVMEKLLEEQFEVIIVGIAAYPLTKEYLGRKIDEGFIEEIKKLNEKYDIHPAGEGGEFESFVLNCPLFSSGLVMGKSKIEMTGEHSGYLEILSFENG